jgi:xylulokinase
MFLLAIDTGTQSTRVSVIDENGKEVASASRTQETDSPHPGWAAQRPSLWWNNAVESIKEIVSSDRVEVEKIAGIGVCGQIHGSVAIDSKGELIDFPVPLW